MQNQVANELGLYNWNQVSYESGILDNQPNDSRFSQLRTDISYSDNQPIDIVRFGDRIPPQPRDDVIDFSQRADEKNIIAFGFGGNDTIVGGNGNNFLYGGPGDDTLVGGSQNNLLDGGDRKTPTAQDGTDTADYSGDLGLAGRHGVSIRIDPGSVPQSAKVDGVAPIMVTDNGFGGTDRLISIEKIKLTGHNDTVTVGPTFGQALQTLQEVDANTQDRNSGDTLDLRPNANGVADPGELESLSQAGIASINVASTAQTGLSIGGNAVSAKSTNLDFVEAVCGL